MDIREAVDTIRHYMAEDPCYYEDDKRQINDALDLLLDDGEPGVGPCPFCGSKDTSVVGTSPFYVYCPVCGACGPQRAIKEDAVLSWNEPQENESSNFGTDPGMIRYVANEIANNDDEENYELLISRDLYEAMQEPEQICGVPAAAGLDVRDVPLIVRRV